MMHTRQIRLICFLTLALLLTGFGWFAGQCLLRMAPHAPLEHFLLHAAETKYTCGMHPMIIADEPGSCPICGMELTPLKTGTGGGASTPQGERRIKYWQAPMDPTYIRAEPGKSPMGMDLIPVYEDESAGGKTIAIDPVTSQNMGVRTAKVSRQDLYRTVRTVGLVSYQEPRQYAVTVKINGWVEKLYVNETGQQVKQGQKLMDIYSPELVSAQEEFLLALDNSRALADSPFPKIARSGQQLLEASRRRLKLWDISDRQVARLEQSHKVEKNLTLYAAQSGIVSMKMVQEGEFIRSGMTLLTISDISKVWVLADIYEYELPWVAVGQQAQIILPFVGRKEVTATLSYLYPYVEPKTRTVKARFELDNPDFELKPDMYVNVQLQTSPVKNALTVPVEAVLHSGERTTVFVALGEGKFEPRQVRIGLQDDLGNLQIVQGLFADERVVTSAQFMLDSESKLREAIAKMLEPQVAPAAPAVHAHGADAKLDDLFGDEKPAVKEQLDDLFK